MFIFYDFFDTFLVYVDGIDTSNSYVDIFHIFRHILRLYRLHRQFCNVYKKRQKFGFAGANGEVLLNFFALFAAEEWISQHDIVTIFILNRQGVGVDNVGHFDAIQNRVHDGDGRGQRFLFFAVEGTVL